MTFFFEDGEKVDIKGQQARSFISQDLNWVVQAHGRLTDVVYGRGAAAGHQASSRMSRVFQVPVRKCRALVSSTSRLFRRETSETTVGCCA